MPTFKGSHGQSNCKKGLPCPCGPNSKGHIMLFDTVHIQFLTQGFDTDRLPCIILDDFFFVEGDKLVNFIVFDHANCSHHIWCTNGHPTIDQDHESLDNLTGFLTGSLFSQNLDNLRTGMNHHIKLFFHQTKMAFIGTKKMKQVIWMTQLNVNWMFLQIKNLSNPFISFYYSKGVKKLLAQTQWIMLVF